MQHLPHPSFFILHFRRGQAALSFVLLVVGIIILVTVAVASIVISFINSSSSFRISNVALAVASAGAGDALIQLARNKDFSAVTPYIVPVGNNSASVTIIQDSPVSGQATIVSRATVLSRKREIQVMVSINQTTGEINIISRQQISS
jgi:uncharacterized protein (UPF0333 family)